jgi:hypothetical protein
MGYVLPRGSSKYVSPNDVIEKALKPAPKVLPKLPPPVKVPPPLTQSNTPRQ